MSSAPDTAFSEDTIAALATAVGGPVVVIRLSGPRALAVAGAVWRVAAPLARPPFRQMRLGQVVGAGGVLDHAALAVAMPGPHSYTGEDVAELHCHGGSFGARRILHELLRSGARLAEPGEFTRRAFLNGRLDLTQAEAVADLIEAHSDAALHLANHQLAGALGRRVHAAWEAAAGVLAEIESRLDFPEEDLDWQSGTALAAHLEGVIADLTALLASRLEGQVLRDGVSLVIAGPPNVGKSSLLNAILGRDRAIVTDLPGTTRDTLEELAHIRGIPLHLVDTAGLRPSHDPIEAMGIERSFRSLRTAQVILWVFDASRPYAEQSWDPQAGRGAVILVGNKRDRLADPAALPALPATGLPVVTTCALDGSGLEALFDAIEAAVWGGPRHECSAVAVSARHAALLEESLSELLDAAARCRGEAWELAAVALRAALAGLGRITGRTHDPDLLGMIFSRFCIGK